MNNFLFIFQDIAKRRECIKTLNCTVSGETATEQLANIMPDYMLVFGISVLAHTPEFDNYEVRAIQIYVTLEGSGVEPFKVLQCP
jgi:hypothetical protein